MSTSNGSGWMARGLVMGVGGLCLAVVLAAGCDTFAPRSAPGTTETTTASAVRDPVLEDVPKPAGFVMVQDRSVARASGKFRVAKVEYVGQADPTTVKRFYEEYLPSAGFQLKQWSLDRGEFTLQFESDGEELRIRVGPDGSQTVIVVDVGPRPQGSAEREVKPPIRQP